MPRTILDVVGPKEISEMFSVTRVTVDTWRREGTLPDPEARLSRGPLWRRTTILRWADATGRAVIKVRPDA